MFRCVLLFLITSHFLFFTGEVLHALKGSAVFNPYQKVLHALAPAFTPFLNNQPIHAYGFGDVRTKDYDVFPLRPSRSTCPDMNDVLDAYNHSARRVSSVELKKRKMSVNRTTSAVFPTLIMPTDPFS